MHKTRLKYGIISGFLTLLVHLFAVLGFGDFIYYCYNSYIFPIIRILYDYTFGLLPFPVIYLFLVLFVVFMITFFAALYRSVRIEGFIKASRSHTINLINIFGWIITSFYFFWAFNYYGPDLDSKLRLREMTLDSLQLIDEFRHVTNILNKERKFLSVDTNELKVPIEWKTMENEIRNAQSELLVSWGDKVWGRVRVRPLYPKGILLRISTAGVYIPFVCEGHIDAGMNNIQWPFTVAHEMAHGYGYTDEGVCNFIGLLSCIKSKDHFIRYSGYLSYWRYIYYDLKFAYPVIADEIYKDLNKGVKADLAAIRRDINRFPDILPQLRDFIYDSYLKSHGVEKGLRSYNEIIIRVQKWKKSDFVFEFD